MKSKKMVKKLLTIGDYLKHKRKDMHLSRKAFAQGIVDSSYLARVEKNKNEIRAITFIELLNKNGISLGDFLDNIDMLHFQNYLYQIKVREAYIAGDLDTLIKLSKNPVTSNIMRIVVNWLIAILTDQIDTFPEKNKVIIKNFLLEVEYWDDDVLWIIANCLGMYDLDQVNGIINRILGSYTDFAEYNDYKIKLLAEIAVNYLELSIKEDSYSIKQAKVANYIDHLPACSSIFYEKLKAKYIMQTHQLPKINGSISFILESI
ncbi:helix-turn-helix domain-containing protein [Lactobacillus hominis]|uniref:helix-turn-helix domain-containing protein n=1 Tax=Lactobacillus hominis TaxID=1203033 RepID=UPI0011C7F7E5|nr:helix-turn-helix transcriptional regulator [Lactobacillus hominis]